MKKVFILANSASGLYGFRFEFLRRLAQEEYSIAVSCPYGEHFKDFSELGITCIDTAIDRRGTNLFSDLKLIFSSIYY